MSEDMSPYCSAHDEWLIMKLCMYVGYHDANNVSNFGGDPVTQLNLKSFIVLFTLFTDLALHSRYAVTVSAAVATRSRAGCSSMEDRCPKSEQTTRLPEIIIHHERGNKRPYHITSLSTALVNMGRVPMLHTASGSIHNYNNIL